MLVRPPTNCSPSIWRGRCASRASAPRPVTLCVRIPDRRNLARRHGCVRLHAAGRIVGFEEMPERAKSTVASLAVYLPSPPAQELLLEHQSRTDPGTPPSREQFADSVRDWPWAPRFAHLLIDQSQIRPDAVRGELQGLIAQLMMMAPYRRRRQALRRAAQLLAELPTRGGGHVHVGVVYL